MITYKWKYLYINHFNSLINASHQVQFQKSLKNLFGEKKIKNVNLEPKCHIYLHFRHNKYVPRELQHFYVFTQF